MLEQLRPLAVFAKTVETKSFRAAARALDLSPSVVSHHVSALEQRHGVALLYRSTRRLSLTPDGEKLFEFARQMLNAAETGLDGLSGRTSDPRGDLRITAPAVLAMGPTIDHIAAFARSFPNVRLSLNFTDQRRDLIGEGIDLAIRMGRLADSTLKSKKLFEVRRKLVAAPMLLADRANPRRPQDVASWEWLQLKSVGNTAVFTNVRGTAQRIQFEPRLVVDDAFALYRLAYAGLGLAMVPEFVAEEDLKSQQISEVLPNWRLASIGVYAVWPPNAPRRGLTARFVEFIANLARGREAGSAPAHGSGPRP